MKIMRSLWIIAVSLTALGLLLSYCPTPAQILAHKPQIWTQKQTGLQLQFVENENLTEINILITRLNHSFASLMTVILLYKIDRI